MKKSLILKFFRLFRSSNFQFEENLTFLNYILCVFYVLRSCYWYNLSIPKIRTLGTKDLYFVVSENNSWSAFAKARSILVFPPSGVASPSLIVSFSFFKSKFGSSNWSKLMIVLASEL